ncbi:MAG: nitrilase-related carbon-nitrogen hydrolase, partial [Pseudomonadota bacterium]
EHADGRVTYGHSVIISPWGEVLAHKADDEPGVITADLDLSRSDDMRQRIPSLALERPVPVRTFMR